MPLYADDPRSRLRHARLCAHRCCTHRSIWRFSPEALKDRILDADCKIVITADEGLRAGKTIPLKNNTDRALDFCPQVKTVIVVKRTGGTINWFDKRDVGTAQQTP